MASGTGPVALRKERPMRTYHVALSWQHKGSGYFKTAESTTKAASAGRAAHLAFQAAKRNGNKIRESEGGQVLFKITIGAKEIPVKED
jgi:hypothetical protein